MSRTLPTSDDRQLARVLGCVVALGLALCASLAPASAQAVSALTWSSTAIQAGGAPTAVSCASEALCVAVNHQGAALSSSDPTSSSPTWSSTTIDTQPLTAVSCAPGGPCVAVDGHGEAFASIDPGVFAWSQSSTHGGVLTGVSCPTASLCVGVDEAGDVLTSTSPGSGDWTLASTQAGHRLLAVSCSSQAFCVAVDGAGDILSTKTPTGKIAWSERKLGASELLAVSCSIAGACVAVSSAGNAVASADPEAPSATWSVTPIDSERLTGVSCASSGLCVAVDARGQALASDDPTAPAPSWSPSSAGSSELVGVSCQPGGFCMAVNTIGDALAGRVRAPEAKTAERPEEATDTTAKLAGMVNPDDAVLGACYFEYGTTVAYTQSVPCAPPLPSPVGGNQGVSAQLSGLDPNTTYHFRLVASSPAGMTAGADVEFTTAVSSLVPIVHPSPSISGTPADGQRLTCHPGTPSGTTAQLTYAWLRDLIPIPGASGSTYTVKGQDTGHHLQCQVTATDGGGSATAKSAFVTIPVGGVPVSAGETAIGRAVFRGGKLVLPVSCSSQASGGCAVALRLTAVETLSGARVVAITARSPRGMRGASAALRHRTVTLASSRLRLARGAQYSVTVALDATGRRLLARERHFGAHLSVTGTVIGVIEAQLGQQLVMLSTSSHSASTHAARRR